MNIGDHYRLTAGGGSTLVVVRAIHDGGLVIVQNAQLGGQAYPFYVLAEDLVPLDR